MIRFCYLIHAPICEAMSQRFIEILGDSFKIYSKNSENWDTKNPAINFPDNYANNFHPAINFHDNYDNNFPSSHQFSR